MGPLVSIIMPARNEAQYIAGAINSVLEQTYRNWELVVINDGSTDETALIVGCFDDPRIHMISQEPRGFGEALNTGLRLARGDILARLDADDQTLPSHIEVQVQFLEAHPEVALVGTLAFYERPDGSRFVPARPAADTQIRRYLYRDNPFIHSSVAFRREVIATVGYYNPRYTSDADYDLWVRVAAQFPVAIIQEPLIVYRLRDQSLSRKRKRSDAIRERAKIQYTAFRLLGPNPLGALYLLRTVAAWAIWKGVQTLHGSRA